MVTKNYQSNSITGFLKAQTKVLFCPTNENDFAESLIMGERVRLWRVSGLVNNKPHDGREGSCNTRA